MYEQNNTLSGSVVVVIATVLVAGQALGHPVGLGYVRTGSMAPTMQPGDGFVAIPAEIAGDVEEGDVVVFRAEELHGGGLTTHRVVDETDRGYVTRGDANPFTDQDNEEPPVKDAQVVAVAWQVGGSVVVIPHLGDAVTAVRDVLTTVQVTVASLLGTRALLGTQGLAYLFFAVSIGYYLIAEYRGGGRTARSEYRSTRRDDGIDPRLIVGAFTVLLIAGTTAPMVLPAGTQEYGVVSAEFDSERPTVIPSGESADVPYPVGNGGILPVVSYVEPASDGVDVSPQRHYLTRDEVHNATVTLHAPPETGYYRRFVVEHRYLAVLPGSTIDALYETHPWAPIVAIDLLIGVPFYLAGIALVGTGNVRARTRDDSRSGTGGLFGR